MSRGTLVALIIVMIVLAGAVVYAGIQIAGAREDTRALRESTLFRLLTSL